MSAILSSGSPSPNLRLTLLFLADFLRPYVTTRTPTRTSSGTPTVGLKAYLKAALHPHGAILFPSSIPQALPQHLPPARLTLHYKGPSLPQALPRHHLPQAHHRAIFPRQACRSLTIKGLIFIINLHLIQSASHLILCGSNGLTHITLFYTFRGRDKGNPFTYLTLG